MKRTFWIVLSLVLSLGCQRKEPNVLDGRLEAYLSDLGPRSAGRLVTVNVREGQRVKAGELLARIVAEEADAAVRRDEAGLAAAEARYRELLRGTRAEQIAQGEARLRDAEAALALATDNLKRAESLARDQILSQAELDRIRTEHRRAEAALALQSKMLTELKAGPRVEQREAAWAERRRADATLEQSRAVATFGEIRAPFDGWVVHRLREEGAIVAPGQAVLTLARADRLWVKAYLPQPLQRRVHLGSPVTVVLPDGRRWEATLDEVASEPEYTPKMVETTEERVNLVYPIRIHLPRGYDQGLLPGMAVTLHLTLDRP